MIVGVKIHNAIKVSTFRNGKLRLCKSLKQNCKIVKFEKKYFIIILPTKKGEFFFFFVCLSGLKKKENSHNFEARYK